MYTCTHCYLQVQGAGVTGAGIWEVVGMEPQTIDLLSNDLWADVVWIILDLCLLCQQSHPGRVDACVKEE